MLQHAPRNGAEISIPALRMIAEIHLTLEEQDVALAFCILIHPHEGLIYVKCKSGCVGDRASAMCAYCFRTFCYRCIYSPEFKRYCTAKHQLKHIPPIEEKNAVKSKGKRISLKSAVELLKEDWSKV
jgi:hypothetical protein